MFSQVLKAKSRLIDSKLCYFSTFSANFFIYVFILMIICNFSIFFFLNFPNKPKTALRQGECNSLSWGFRYMDQRGNREDISICLSKFQVN